MRMLIFIIMGEQYQLTGILKQRKYERQQITLEQLDEESRYKVQKLLGQYHYDKQKQIQKDNQFYIDSQSKFTLSWNLIYIIVFYYSTLQISVSIALPPTILQGLVSIEQVYLPVYLTILVFWCIDIVLSFFKGYYVIGQVKVVSDLRLTTLRYLKTHFVLDIIVVVIYTIPLYYQAPQINFLQLIPMLFVWVKKTKYSKQIQKILQYKRQLQTAFLMTQLFIDALIVSNYAGCIFLGMDLYLYNQSYYGQGTSSPYYWLTNNADYPISLIDGPWWDAYIWAQSFSTGTLATLAPGPFVKNPWQAFYSLFIIIAFMILASYIGDIVIELLSLYLQARQGHEENIIAFDKFMALKEVKKDVRIKINNYYQLVWQLEMKIQSQEHEELIEKLPIHIREQLMMEMGFTKHLHFLQFVQDEAELKKMIALKIQRATIDSDTCIFESNKSIARDRKLFYLKEGMAKFYLTDKQIQYQSRISQNLDKSEVKEKVLSLTNVGKLLGVYEFVTGQNYMMCCKSIDLCLIQTLKWSDFWDIITELQIEEQFYQMKDKVLFQRQLSHIDKLCVVCLSQHIQSQCPYLYYSKKVQNSIDFSNLTSSQRKRIKKVRNYKSSKKTIKMLTDEQIFQKLLKDIILDIFDNNSLKQNHGSEIQEAVNFQKYKKQFNIETY